MNFQSFNKNTSFSIEIISEYYDDNIDTYAYPGALINSWFPGFGIMVSLQDSSQWIGRFLAGKESPNGDNFCGLHPNGKSLVVISKGRGYIVSIENPELWEELSLTPIMGHCYDKSTNTLVLYGFTKLLGIQETGVAWKTDSMSWDGLKLIKLQNGLVKGLGWDSTISKDVPFEVKVIDGEIQGGARPPLIDTNKRV